MTASCRQLNPEAAAQGHSAQRAPHWLAGQTKMAAPVFPATAILKSDMRPQTVAAPILHSKPGGAVA